MFNTKDIKTTKYPNDHLGFSLNMQLGFIRDMIDFQEKQYVSELKKFEERVRKKEFIFHVEEDGFEHNSDERTIIEASLDTYRWNSRKLILILLVSFFEEQMEYLYGSFIKHSKIKDSNTDGDKGITRYRKYFRKDVTIDESKFIKNIEPIISLINIRNFYVHPTKEKEIENKIDLLIKQNKKFKLQKFYSLTGKHSISLSEISVLQDLIVNIDKAILGISDELARKIK